jgi:hypothetical protein
MTSPIAKILSNDATSWRDRKAAKRRYSDARLLDAEIGDVSLCPPQTSRVIGLDQILLARTMRTPSGPAMTAAATRPMKSPCSTTPGTSASRDASPLGSGIRTSAASSIWCPPSVTKGWPSWPRRKTAGPGRPAAMAAASTARRVATTPNGTTSDRQREMPQLGHAFGIVGNHNHAGGGGGNDLFPQQRAAATFDDRKVGSDLVGAVHGQIELWRLVYG